MGARICWFHMPCHEGQVLHKAQYSPGILTYPFRCRYRQHGVELGTLTEQFNAERDMSAEEVAANQLEPVELQGPYY